MDDNDQHPLTKYIINVKDVVGYVQQSAQGCCGLSFDCSQCVPQVPNVLPKMFPNSTSFFYPGSTSCI